jgi:hypothetical protein
MRPDLTAEQQLLHLRRSGLCHGSGDVRRGDLTWRFQAQPTPASRVYDIRIELPLVGSLDVIVDKPDLRLLADGRRIPHVYGEAPMDLCLFRPEYGEWQGWMRLDETIVPWTYAWLFYFEHWLARGEWLGGGEHPDPDADVPPPRWRRRALPQRLRARDMRARVVGTGRG